MTSFALNQYLLKSVEVPSILEAWHDLSQNTKNTIKTVAVVAFTTLLVAMVMAGTTGGTGTGTAIAPNVFDNAAATVQGWATGSLTRVIMFGALIIGLGLSVAKSSIMPLVVVLVITFFAITIPAVIIAMTTSSTSALIM